MGSKCVRVAKGTGGEPEVAEQPLQLPAHWMLEQVASNIGRSLCLHPMSTGGQRLN